MVEFIDLPLLSLMFTVWAGMMGLTLIIYVSGVILAWILQLFRLL